MPVNKGLSIVADSTILSSPQPEAVVEVVTRAARTYGRRLRPLEETNLTLYPSLSESISKRNVYKTGRQDEDDEVPPSPPSQQLDADLADDECEEDRSARNQPKFRFKWQEQLAEIDRLAEIDTGHPDSDKPLKRLVPQFGQPVLLQQSANTDIVSRTRPTTPSSITPFDDIFSGPSIPTADHASQFEETVETQSSRSLSPDIIPVRRRKTKRVVAQNSDTDTGSLQPNKNTPSGGASSDNPYPITTPKTVSSPTPPTSDDEMPAEVMPKVNLKGKRRADIRHSVLPLNFEEGSVNVAPNNQGRRVSRKTSSKIKPLTKKDRKEMLRDRARLVSEQAISIQKVDNSNRYSLSNLFTTLKSHKSLGQVSSDPICDFSSPHTHQEDDIAIVGLKQVANLHVSRTNLPKISERALRASTSRQLRVLSDSDSEMPTIGQALIGSDISLEMERQRTALLEKKKVILAHQQQVRTSIVASEDEDDLVVIASENTVKHEEVPTRAGPTKVSEGRKRQMNLGGIGVSEQLKSPGANKNSSIGFETILVNTSRQGHNKKALTQSELNKILTTRVKQVNHTLTRSKEEDWRRYGGKELTTEKDGGGTVTDTWLAYAEQGLKIAESRGPTLESPADDDNDSDSDGDWAPQLLGSASPRSDMEQDGLNDILIGQGGKGETVVNENEDEPTMSDDNDMRVSHHRKIVLDSDDPSENSDVENRSPGPSYSRRERKLQPVGGQTWSSRVSQDEESEVGPLSTSPSNRAHLHRRSTSSFDEQNEDENDKENNTRLMFDRSEDKENKAVARHGAINRTLIGSISGPTVSVIRTAPLSPSSDFDADQSFTHERRQSIRKPFKEIVSPGSPLASNSEPSNLTQSFVRQIGPISQSPRINSPTSVALKSGFSQFPDDGDDVFGAAPLLQPSFSDLFESGTAKQGFTNSVSNKSGSNSLGSSFSENTGKAIQGLKRTDTLGLTQDVVLQPAFQVEENLLRKADRIFEKEQEYLLDAVDKKPQQKPELYVNEHGFLTQTRPEVSSPEVYRPSPSPNLHATRQTSQRAPLRTLSLSGPFDFDSPQQQRKRLIKRGRSPSVVDSTRHSSPSTSPPTRFKVPNAFEVLAQGAMKQKTVREGWKPLNKSDFIENEAQESDEDEMLGFGLGKAAAEDEEEDGEDLDQILETLVDDQEMDETVVARDLVIEKFNEQEEDADKENEKLHIAAIQGELRRKRRHGLGMDDSDDESEDEKNRRIRQGMSKKARIDRDDIEALGVNEETKSFYNAYKHTWHDDDDATFAYLQQQHDDVVMNNENNDEEEEENVIGIEEVRRQIREVAQRQEVEEPLNPHDVSWVDNDEHEDSIGVHIKNVVSNKDRRNLKIKDRHMESEFQEGFELRASSTFKDERIRMRNQAWLRDNSKSHGLGVSRRTEGAAVTGHGKAKVKTGGESSRRSTPIESVAGGSKKRNPGPAKTLKSEASVLANVDRSSRFG